MTSARPAQSPPSYGWPIFILLAVAGLFYVKWFPYYHRAFTAEETHSIGKSILMGGASTAPDPSFSAALDYAFAYGKAIWQAMVLGLLLGSGVQALLPVQWVARVLGRRGFGSVAAGGLLAVPGMMCTCCAAPVVVGLRARNASAGGAIAFWLGNSVLNPATLVFMGFVLGWQWSALRLALGLLMVFGLGWVCNRLVTPEESRAAEDRLALLTEQQAQGGNVFVRWARIFARMAVRLVPEYIVLVLLLGAARAWLFPHIGPEVTSSLGWIVTFAVVGMLFVIPTAGEVPIIQAMLALGMGVGPAGALLMTLPPVSVPSFAMLAGSFRPRMLVVVGSTVVFFGIVAGLAAVTLGF
ncbi:permease [Paraburkholderia sp. J8-2]|uniref:permease n=1 Tax=Paraburkholderia sp. J8-2 TaxID=2805440 RepID=UPI002AB7ADC6|nr:permease [Paraburkholderia sp. J8-2]